MITVDDKGRYYCVHYRTNNRTQWRFAEYAGRWESKDRAIQEARDRMSGQHGQCLVENMRTGEEAVIIL